MLRELFAGRRSLFWLLGPVVLFLVAVPLVNRVEPVVFGLSLFMWWMILATLLSPLCIIAAAKGDPVFRAGRSGDDR
ncbi:DUF3311 domain-containing protein [Pseudonocardia spinosispora]|uniref:DUF3311 domain-containing protein n=1 Tax=Pseudonocardia spinosispora TaxID=103441 RepID=UPI0003FDEE2F|nr:DUF3311 domain-containing protein [Pseudonocardia spinosispora]